MAQTSDPQRKPLVFRPTDRVVDQGNASLFLQGAQDALSSGIDVVIDLSELRFLSSAGLGSIVTLVRDAGTKGRKVRIAGAQPTVKALFGMVRLSNIVPIDSDVAASLAHLAAVGEGGGDEAP